MRQRRWLEFVKDYHFAIQYHPGKANVVADALSRRPYVSISALFASKWDSLKSIDVLAEAFAACLVVTPAIISKVVKAQALDPQCIEKVQELSVGELPFYSLDSNGGLRYKGRLVVSFDTNLRRAVMDEAHMSKLAVHPGGDKMYQDMKRQFWWAGMKKDIAVYVSKCSTCQMVKIDHQRPPGTLQPLPVPEWKWDSISMDFIVGLPISHRNHDAIWVIVDRLTKASHFLPVRSEYTSEQYARLYIAEIVKLHGIPISIISDRDPSFVSGFWQSFQQALGTELCLSTAYHPQTDGQTERVNQILEDMLRACVMDFKGNWEHYLPLVEFAYNNSFQKTIGMAPFEALYGRPCRSPVCWMEVGENRMLGPDFIKDTSEKIALIRDRMRTAQSRQKSYADRRKRHLEFAVGDQVLLKVSPMKGVMRFGKKGKLAPRFVGPFMITERIGSLAYRLALPDEMHRVHNVFHVSMLRKFLRDDDAYQHIDITAIDLQQDASYVEQPYRILDRRNQVLRSKIIPLVRVQWSHHNEAESTWEREDEVQVKYPELFTPGM